eukprot:Cvel_10710.t1-p1 / transcript=Cvel_10710.t1 / gene=Cvel_10710 / organism=Chromera_velia_CCMP2878 / gene_product=hypothetical protein / transcript_product=hypothetical protein / location=Cvel_scaffold651:60539-61930(+) / protein_length=399 / sequence_SO=supercontig / SO=protein_coding / is_pseudo=false
MGDVMQRADWAAADRELGESWARVMGFSPMEWGQVSEQAYLPQYQEGLGLTCFDTTAAAGLVGSCAITLEAVVARLAGQSFLGLAVSVQDHRQAFLSLPWLVACKDALEDTFKRAQRMTKDIKLKADHPLYKPWDDQSQRWWSHGDWLGLSIPEMRRAGVCACGAALDVRGHHAQKCPNGGGVVWRHEQVKGAFMEILWGLRHTHVLEETTFGHLGVAIDSRFPDRRHKRVDIFASLSTDDTMVADVSVTFPISFDAARLRTRAKTAGAAARTRSEEKIRKYAAAVRSVGLRFIPLVFESFGRPDKETVSFVKELVTVAMNRAGVVSEGSINTVRSRLTDRYWKILGCTLQRYVAINILTSAFHDRGQRGPFQPASLLGRELSTQLSHNWEVFVQGGAE